MSELLRTAEQAVRPAARDRSLRHTLRGLLTLSRPLQWVKGGLVAAAPIAAGRWVSGPVAVGTAVAFICFTVAAAGCYMINDVRDVERDRWHPTKRLRPLPAGTVTVATAARTGIGCVVGGPALAAALGYGSLAAIVATYVLITCSYSLGLKHVPLVEIAAVASGFVLRALAGAAATHIPPSAWFLGVVGSGAAMVAVGKRSAELALTGAVTGHRASLRRYSVRGLRAARALAALFMVGCYLGWVVTRPAGQMPPAAVSAVVVGAAALRFLIRSERGEAGAPERLLLTDHWLQLCVLVWLAALFVGPAHV